LWSGQNLFYELRALNGRGESLRPFGGFRGTVENGE
jgi:hypothetical protein